MESIRVTSDPNTLAAQVVVHDGTGYDLIATFYATVEVTTGEVHRGLPDNAIIQWNPITPSQPNTEYYASDVQGSTVTLTGPNGFSSKFSQLGL
jgi:hypothetical protein